MPCAVSFTRRAPALGSSLQSSAEDCFKVIAAFVLALTFCCPSDLAALLSAARASVHGLASRSARRAATSQSVSSEFWQINQNFPGLKAVCGDPAAFLVEDLLSEEMCEMLIAKATPRLKQSMMQDPHNPEGGYIVDPRRSSFDGRMGFDEVFDVQQRFSELLSMESSHFETLKVTRYEPGQQFALHHDGNEGQKDGFPFCPTPYCTRVVTLFCYLRDCAEGGATHFPLLGLRVQPKRGMGVIHFPARMPVGLGRRDERCLHQGELTVEGHAKYICQQWGWTGPINRDLVPQDWLPAGKPAVQEAKVARPRQRTKGSEKRQKPTKGFR